MPLTDTRLSRLEKVFTIGKDDPGLCAMVSSNAWPDEERAAFEAGLTNRNPAPGMEFVSRFTVTPDVLDLVSQRVGTKVGMIIDVPAPAEIVALPAAERAAWCDQHETRADRVRAA